MFNSVEFKMREKSKCKLRHDVNRNKNALNKFNCLKNRKYKGKGISDVYVYIKASKYVVFWWAALLKCFVCVTLSEISIVVKNIYVICLYQIIVLCHSKHFDIKSKH